MPAKNTEEYRALPLDEVFRLLSTTRSGLTHSEAARRTPLYGYNEVAERKRRPLLRFFDRYWGPMPWLLEVAIALAYFLRHYLEAAIIFALLTMNAVIGFVQERGSQKALESLKNRLAAKARVLRDGKWIMMEARQLVPGDIVALNLGDVVPADAKITFGRISVDQSVLTGESAAADVQVSSIVYSGSIVKRGEAEGVVVNTGGNTYFGRTAELVRIARPKSHQEEIMLAIVRYMMGLGVVALALVTAYSLLTGEGFLVVVTLAVIFLMGAVPVALPAVLTIVQSVGAAEMARKGVLVARLDSIENAASIDVLCLDKTGTITENRLSVSDVIPFEGYSKTDVTETAALASQELGEDDIDLAVIAYAQSAGCVSCRARQVSVLPFDPANKRSEAIIETDGKRFRVVKGAPQIVISQKYGIDPAVRREADRLVEELSQKGNRTLAVARSEGDDLDNLRLVGLVSLTDPPRPHSREMIVEVRGLGIKPVMLTGDNIAIARELGRRVSIGDKIMRIEELRGMSEAEQARAIEEHDGFAEIYPEDKYRIVRLLQRQGHLVGMTGDGVNDAPALKQAEMGIAVSSATDVAKASAGIVLTEPGIRVIVDAIRTSRHIYQRMLTWVINKVTKVIQVVGLLTAGFFLMHDAVVSLLGMALLVCANDFVTMSLATDNVKVTRNPNTWNVRNITLASLFIAMPLVLEGVIALLIGKNYFHLGAEGLHTFVLLLLIFTSQFRVYIVRERRYFWSSRPGTALMLATIVALVTFVILGLSGFIIPPLAANQVFFVLGFSALFTFALDVPKRFAFRRFGL